MIQKNTSKRMDLSDVRCILSEIQAIFEKQPNLAPLDILFKIIRIVEHGDVEQLKRVEYWIFELARMLYDTGFLRSLTDNECSTLFSKINSVKNLVKERMV